MKTAIEEVKQYFLNLQQSLCRRFEEEDGKAQFKNDDWVYAQGEGGGSTRILKDGDCIEKAGVNFSHVKGNALPMAATAKRPHTKDQPFQALGVSVVVHPLNPYAPTSHFNLRFIVIEDGKWWFGGGFDLTPYYGFEEDCQHWHATAKAACDPFGADLYATYKKWCDDYFYLPHRQEPRGIGGLFFDDIQGEFDKSFAFIKSIGEAYPNAYLPILHRRKSIAYREHEVAFQHYRRGRYVEFNLLYDRGTLFGLQSNGRTESILMSLPPKVRWEYNYQVDEQSQEAELYGRFLTARDWI